jgi:hypothetical protein
VSFAAITLSFVFQCVLIVDFVIDSVRNWAPPSLLSNRLTGTLSLVIKRLGREVDHLPPASAEVKEWVELYLRLPNTPSWRGAQLKEVTGGTLPLPFTFTQSGNFWIHPRINKFETKYFIPLR